MAYERYFAGLERLEPLQAREALRRTLARLMGGPARSTARRFRLTTLQATLLTHEGHWERLTRQIEAGTFRRDRRRAEAATQAAAKAGAPGPAPRAPSADAPGAGAPAYPEHIVALHRDYEAARLAAGGAAPAVSIAALAATVSAQAATIRARVQCQEVSFQVAIKDGRPILRAKAR